MQLYLNLKFIGLFWENHEPYINSESIYKASLFILFYTNQIEANQNQILYSLGRERER